LIHLHISPDCRERRPFRFNTLRADSRPFASHLFWRTPLTTGFCEALVTEFLLTDLPDERLLTKPQTAALLGASIDTLDRWATRGQGRPRLRFSSRMSRCQASVHWAALPEQRTAFAAQEDTLL
jgi:hypothetical protein